MPSHSRSAFLTSLLLSLTPLIFAGDLATSTQTVASVAPYSALDPCARSCFQYWLAGCWAPVLDAALGCASEYCTLADNYCMCRTDHQPVATSFLSRCISSSCTV